MPIPEHFSGSGQSIRLFQSSRSMGAAQLRRHGLRFATCAISTHRRIPMERSSEQHEPKPAHSACDRRCCGERPPLTLFGTDYHARRNLCARLYSRLRIWLRRFSRSTRLAQGQVAGRAESGHRPSYSVAQVLKAAADVLGKPIPPATVGPAPCRGPTITVADSQAARARSAGTHSVPTCGH